jgi:hypothetical protein
MQNSRRSVCAVLAVFLGSLCVLRGESPCVSGLQPGQRPGPYSFVICTGPQRGQPFCYICDTAERPAVVVFSRTLNDAVGKLTGQIDKAVTEHKTADLRAWVTFLADDETRLNKQVVEWGQKHVVRNVPLGVFEDVGGPPSYRLNRDADVTVLLFVKQKVVANFAFRSGELTEEKVGEVMKTLPRIVGEKK